MVGHLTRSISVEASSHCRHCKQLCGGMEMPCWVTLTCSKKATLNWSKALLKVVIYANLLHGVQMFLQISRIPDLIRKFWAKKCGLYADVYGTWLSSTTRDLPETYMYNTLANNLLLSLLICRHSVKWHGWLESISTGMHLHYVACKASWFLSKLSVQRRQGSRDNKPQSCEEPGRETTEKPRVPRGSSRAILAASPLVSTKPKNRTAKLHSQATLSAMPL